MTAVQIEEDENNIDMMADRVSNYLVQISTHISSSVHMEIMNHYYSGITEYERLGRSRDEYSGDCRRYE